MACGAERYHLTFTSTTPPGAVFSTVSAMRSRAVTMRASSATDATAPLAATIALSASVNRGRP